MPINVLSSRFSNLVNERSIVKQNGQISGEVFTSTYNF